VASSGPRQGAVALPSAALTEADNTASKFTQ
jgi:hypothetical protein